jgi:CRISPR-associated protein Csy2
MNHIEKMVVGYLFFNKVKIENANAISSPMTYGMPSITGFLGAFHALSRKVSSDENLQDLSLGGVLIACHDCTPKVYRPNPYSNYTFNQTRNPIKKDGSTASIIEEGKCNLTMSFVVEILAENATDDTTNDYLAKKCEQWIQQQRIAGGSVMGLARFDAVSFIEYSKIEEIIPRLMPAFVLMDASDNFSELINIAKDKNPDSTPLDVLLDVATLHHVPELQPNGSIKWLTQSVKTGYGWLVPMPIGYQGISEPFDVGVMQEVRNPEYPSQYVECVYGLGRWLYPHHLKGDYKILSAFWRYQQDVENNLFLVQQQVMF